MNGQMDARMDGLIVGYIDGRTNGCIQCTEYNRSCASKMEYNGIHGVSWRRISPGRVDAQLLQLKLALSPSVNFLGGHSTASDPYAHHATPSPSPP